MKVSESQPLVMSQWAQIHLPRILGITTLAIIHSTLKDHLAFVKQSIGFSKNLTQSMFVGGCKQRAICLTSRWSVFGPLFMRRCFTGSWELKISSDT